MKQNPSHPKPEDNSNGKTDGPFPNNGQIHGLNQNGNPSGLVPYHPYYPPNPFQNAPYVLPNVLPNAIMPLQPYYGGNLVPNPGLIPVPTPYGLQHVPSSQQSEQNGYIPPHEWRNQFESGDPQNPYPNLSSPSANLPFANRFLLQLVKKLPFLALVLVIAGALAVVAIKKFGKKNFHVAGTMIYRPAEDWDLKKIFPSPNIPTVIQIIKTPELTNKLREEFPDRPIDMLLGSSLIKRVMESDTIEFSVDTWMIQDGEIVINRMMELAGNLHEQKRAASFEEAYQNAKKLFEVADAAHKEKQKQFQKELDKYHVSDPKLDYEKLDKMVINLDEECEKLRALRDELPKEIANLEKLIGGIGNSKSDTPQSPTEKLSGEMRIKLVDAENQLMKWQIQLPRAESKYKVSLRLLNQKNIPLQEFRKDEEELRLVQSNIEGYKNLIHEIKATGKISNTNTSLLTPASTDPLAEFKKEIVKKKLELQNLPSKLKDLENKLDKKQEELEKFRSIRKVLETLQEEVITLGTTLNQRRIEFNEHERKRESILHPLTKELRVLKEAATDPAAVNSNYAKIGLGVVVPILGIFALFLAWSTWREGDISLPVEDQNLDSPPASSTVITNPTTSPFTAPFYATQPSSGIIHPQGLPIQQTVPTTEIPSPSYRTSPVVVVENSSTTNHPSPFIHPSNIHPANIHPANVSGVNTSIVEPTPETPPITTAVSSQSTPLVHSVHGSGSESQNQLISHSPFAENIPIIGRYQLQNPDKIISQSTHENSKRDPLFSSKHAGPYDGYSELGTLAHGIAASFDLPGSIILFTPVTEQVRVEGLVSDLSRHFAKNGEPVLVFDARGMNFTSSNFPMNADPVPKIDSFIRGDVNDPSECFASTDIPSVQYARADLLQRLPAGVMAMYRFRHLVQEMRDRYVRILMITSPHQNSEELQLLTSFSEGVVMVVHDQIQPAIVEEYAKNLRNVEAPILGAVVIGNTPGGMF